MHIFPYRGRPGIFIFFLLLALPCFLVDQSRCLAGQERSTSTYIGAQACQPCHPREYQRFSTYAKKSRSFESIQRLRKGLTAEEIKRCFGCHTTGYGKPGGFVSIAKTPHLKNAGCEVCHGPGSTHARTGATAAIKRSLTKEDCEGCHTSERVLAFRFKPLIHGGAH
ncbi:MAG: cytochrome c family protein [Desulfobulbaceae bacterium]|nr:cytochrome c family protein [Desulfobulbaceae bacterium]